MATAQTASEPRKDEPVGELPMEVRAALTALQKRPPLASDRRRRSREQHQVQAAVWYKSPRGQIERATIYTRDFTEQVVSFVTQTALKPGQGVVLDVVLPGCTTGRLNCRVCRCRQFLDGWFEGLLQIKPS